MQTWQVQNISTKMVWRIHINNKFQRAIMNVNKSNRDKTPINIYLNIIENKTELKVTKGNSPEPLK